MNKHLKVKLDNANNIMKNIVNKDGYCPCRLQKTEDNKCICKEVRDGGDCICGLYEWVEEYKDEDIVIKPKESKTVKFKVVKIDDK